MAKPKSEKPVESMDLRALAAEASKPAPVAELVDQPKRVQLTPREIEFTFEYDSPEGEDHIATLTSRVLDADGRMAKARVYNQLSRGLVAEYMTQEDMFRVDALSRMSLQLIEPPKWLIDAAGMDLNLLISLNNVLVEHETRYFRGNARKGEGDEIKARVRVSVPAFESGDEG